MRNLLQTAGEFLAQNALQMSFSALGGRSPEPTSTLCAICPGFSHISQNAHRAAVSSLSRLGENVRIVRESRTFGARRAGAPARGGRDKKPKEVRNFHTLGGAGGKFCVIARWQCGYMTTIIAGLAYAGVNSPWVLRT